MRERVATPTPSPARAPALLNLRTTGNYFAAMWQLLRRNVERFRGGLVFKAHRLFYLSTIGLIVIKRRGRSDP